MPSFLRFTDRNGLRWRVYFFSIITGEVIYYSPGAGGAQYKGFVPEPRTDGRPRRRFMMRSLRPDDMLIDLETLQLQLDKSVVDFRDRRESP